ncbi:hypothetical protein DVH24_011924 [Malus domestica]|uniref:Uncharacterized protein n=1 Tax=Malus domestica TaxID=3750 RepID=A0A498JBN2_MALDO|nr:hypothetical protein DVH24_011924 [Malus domestica]
MLQVPFNFYDRSNSSTPRLVLFCKILQSGDETARHYIPDELHFDMIIDQSHVKIKSSAPVWYLCVWTFGRDCSFNQHNIWIQPRVNVRRITVVLLRGNFQYVLHCLKGESKGSGMLILVQILEPSIVVPVVQTNVFFWANYSQFDGV